MFHSNKNSKKNKSNEWKKYKKSLIKKEYKIKIK